MSDRKNDVVLREKEKLKISLLSWSLKQEGVPYDFLENKKCNPKHIAFVGNDLNDLGAMQLAGLSICPADSHASIKEIADIKLLTREVMGD